MSVKAKLFGRIACQMFIRQEKHALSCLQRPVEDILGVGRGADSTTKGANLCFESHRGIDVGYGDNIHTHALKLVQNIVDMATAGHERHHAVGMIIWQEDLLPWPCEQGSGLSHKVDAAEDKIGSLNVRNLASQLQGVSCDITMSDDTLTLIVMAENTELGTKLLAKKAYIVVEIMH